MPHPSNSSDVSLTALSSLPDNDSTMPAPVSPMQVSKTATAPITEIFSSIQGEGPYVGVNQVFVRFSHCHLKCHYCDTPMSASDGHCHIAPVFGEGESTSSLRPNPFNASQLLETLFPFLQTGLYHSVSVTGGEPLLYHNFLTDVFPHIRQYTKTYLETSGTQPDRLKAVLPHTDIIAMDIKLPSATGERDYFSEHHAFLALAVQQPECDTFAKVVFNNAITAQEIQSIITLMQPHPQMPVILQPESDAHGQTQLTQERLFRVQHTLLAAGLSVRVIPQTHKQLSIR